jgi:hypothetical protein
VTDEERTTLLSRLATAKGELVEISIRGRVMRERREALEAEIEGLEQQLEKQ